MIRAALLFPVCGLLAQAPPSLQDLVERFDANQARVETMSANFTLQIRRAMLKTPSVTKGALHLKGSEFVHFAFDPPEDLILHLTPKELLSYNPDSKEGQRTKIGRVINANRKFLGLGQKLSFLRSYFEITYGDSKEPSGTYLFSLLPKTHAMRKRMQNLQMWVDRETLLPRQVIWTERSGDVWQLELSNIRINQSLPASVLNFSVPMDVPWSADFNFFATRKK